MPADKTAFAYTMAACVLPFIPGDILKIIVAVPVALKLRPVVAQYLYSERGIPKQVRDDDDSVRD